MANLFRAAVLSGVAPTKPDALVQAPKPAPVAVEEETPAHDHRWNDRHSLNGERAVIRYNGEEHEVSLLNLSGGGAMVRGDFGARMWDKLWLVLDLDQDASIECAVRWIRRDRFGLEFAHETQINCDRQSRDELLKEVIRRSFPGAEHDEDPADFGVVEGAAPDDQESQRAERRHPLIWMADVPFDHSFVRVRIRNISETGAMVESATYFPVGTEVMLDMGEAGQYFAKVAWARGDQFGFAFVKPFDLTNLARARATLAPQRWAQPSYLRQDSSKASPWAEHWDRQSLDEMRDDLGGFLGR